MKKKLTPIQEQVETLKTILKHGYNAHTYKKLGFIAERHEKRLRQIKESTEGNENKNHD